MSSVILIAPTGTIRDVSEETKQFMLRLETLRRPVQVGIAHLIQRLQTRGYGEKHLIDAMIDANIWEDPFYKGVLIPDVAVGRLCWIATDNACHIGHTLTVDNIRLTLSNYGIVV